MGVQIDAEAFGRRLQKLKETWQNDADGTLFGGATALAVCTGSRGEEDAIRYLKSVSLHLYLLGYEFTDTVLVLTPAELHALAGSKKVGLLEPLAAAAEAAGLTLRLHSKPKKESGEAQMGELLEALRGSAVGGGEAVVGTLPREVPAGGFAEGWSAALGSLGLRTVDISAGLGAAFAAKDDVEVKSVRKAAYLASTALTQFTVQELEGVIDAEKKVRHSKLAERTEEVLTDPSKLKLKLKGDVVDTAYPPLIQSGGEYSFRPGAVASSDKPVHYGVIACSLGARYASYCANVARTYFVNPSERQQAVYAAIQAAHGAAVAALVEGAPMSAAYAAAQKALQDKGQPELAERLGKDVGSVIGLELRDRSLPLSPSNDRPVAPGMTFNVSIGITGLERPDAEEEAGRSYGVLLSDTVVVVGGGSQPDMATASAPKDWNEVAYYLDQDEEGEEDAEVQEVAAAAARAEAAAGPTRKSARTEHIDFKAREEERRRQKENQEDLLERVNQATLAMLSKSGAGGAGGAAGGRKLTDLNAYKGVEQMQHNNTLTVQVDHKSECVLVPIYGMLVPFHILTVKNASMNQDNDNAYIRVNFNFGPSYEPSAKHPTAICLKEVSFRTSDTRHAAKVVQEIKALRSAVQQRDKEKAERATLVRQEKLIRAKGRIYALPDVWIRPAFGGEGRKMTGTLEAHANGFRYMSPKGEELDVMYRNIKHAFFQPSDKEMITLVHFHLHNPIMVGKKKTQDVQFYTEVMDSVQTLDAGRRSMYDPDEIEEEQRERERRNQINKQFSQFVKRVQQDVWERDFGDLNLEFEIPFRELGFHGVPSRTNCFIMPTVNCLVELTEMPFTVITLSEVNLVNLERVGFNLRNFDMIFIWKDLNRDVGRIDSIPSQSLDTIKEWLTSIEIKYYESKVNLNWKNILKSIKDDPEGFIEDGGWSFLDADQSDSEDERGEEESDFAPSGDEESEEVSSEDESLMDEDEEDDGSDYDEEEDSEGMDWDELEEEARREDKEREYSDSDDDRKRSKKKQRR